MPVLATQQKGRRVNREQRRRAERAARGAKTGSTGAWTPPAGRITQAKFVPATSEELERQRQDFLAGTVFAAGAGVVFPQGEPGPEPMEALFTIYVHDDQRTYGPAPQLRRAFGLLDEHGTVALHKLMTVGTCWSVMDGPQPLAKLRLEFHQPAELCGRVEIVLLAENYRDLWQHIVGGGMVGLSTLERMQRVNAKPGATFADALETSVVLGIGSSPGIAHLMASHGWPGR